MIRRFRRFRRFLSVLLPGALLPLGCGDGIARDDAGGADVPPRAVLYLNFDGGQLSASSADDATADLTELTDLVGTRPAYSSGTFGCDEVADIVAEHFSPFEIEISCERPNRGPYTMVVVSPLEQPSGDGGIQWHAPAPDCGNANESNVGLVEVASGASLDPRAVAVAVSHVAGITYGLDEGHDFPLDLASFDASPDATWFDMCFPIFDDLSCPEQNLANCGAQDGQNSYRELATVLGER